MRGGLCKKQVLLRCLIFVILYIVVFNVHSLLFGANRSCTTDCPNGRSLPWLPANANLRERARQAALERELSPAKQLRQIPARAFHDHSPGHPMQLERRNSTGRRNGKDTYRDGGVLNYALFNAQGQFQLEPPHYKPRQLPIFPDEVDSPDDDRIWNQMRYVPRKVAEGAAKTKKILFYNGLGGEMSGNRRLVQDNCPVQNCDISGDRSLAPIADVILWQRYLSVPFHRRPPNQVWALFFLESPYHTPGIGSFTSSKLKLNWTATYRHDSVIVAPYYKYTPYAPDMAAKMRAKLSTLNFAKGKVKKVAWFVSNCGAQNGRLQYAQELSNHIQVDIYGACGRFSCPRSQTNSCFRMLSRDYKFYLAFENSNCRDYITEKFFLNGLSNAILPIVMGAHPDDYRRAAPPHSFIHVDDFATPKDLAAYLLKLDADDSLYNAYFAWKGSGLVDTNTFFMCRLCMMAHEAENHEYVIADPEQWWRGNICVTTPWPKTKRGG